MPVDVVLHDSPSTLPEAATRVALGRRERLRDPAVLAALAAELPAEVWTAMLGRGDPGDDGRASGTWWGAPARRIVAGVLPERCSRHNSTTRAWAIPRLLSGTPRTHDSVVLVSVEDGSHALASVLAVARAFPRFDARGSKRGVVHVAVLGPDGPVPIAAWGPAVEAVLAAAALGDRPPNDLDTTAFVQAARQVVARHPEVELTVIEGEALRDGGFGGLWAVGKAAVSPPALVVLRHAPAKPDGHDAWVGKGIVYDTGGLSLKSKSGMPGMKSDMCGAAAVLSAFEAAVALGSTRAITAVLCLAENAVGPEATRPDDIITMYSGKTVEVNNTDAEGRLVLGDGVAWVTRHAKPDRVVDLATLTGAQAVATGKSHAAVVCNDDGFEAEAVAAGRGAGELVFPLPFAPEFYRREFRSSVADLRNSVKDRANAQTSCAAEFIRQHLTAELPWLHVDLVGPATHHGRATGFGVGLLLRLSGVV